MLQDLLNRLDAKSLGDALPDKWTRAQKDFPPERYASEFLTSEAIAENMRKSDLDDSYREPLEKMAGRVKADSDLLALAAYAHWRIFRDEDPKREYDWPTLEKKLGDDSKLFYLLVALGFAVEYERRQAPFSIPETVIRNTCQQTARYAENYRYGTGRFGIYPGQLCWFKCYFPPARYYRIGRLEFCQGTYRSPFRFYRNKWNGKIVALALADTWYTAEGRAPFPDLPRPDDAWQPTFEERDGFAIGYPLGENGCVQRTLLPLSLSNWDLVLQPGDPILDTHIPSGGGMRPELVRDSLKEALHFFDAHFPDSHVRGFTSGSWIFSPQLKEMLPADSNILAFQDMLHILPCGAPRGSGLWFVFLCPGPYDGSTELPTDTSLRRNIANWLKKGKPFQEGAMLLLREEAEAMPADVRR